MVTYVSYFLAKQLSNIRVLGRPLGYLNVSSITKLLDSGNPNLHGIIHNSHVCLLTVSHTGLKTTEKTELVLKRWLVLQLGFTYLPRWQYLSVTSGLP